MKNISGISEIIDKYDAYFIDIWGVLHNGIMAYPETNLILTNLQNRGKKICLVSNTPRREEQIKTQNVAYGIPNDPYYQAKTAGGECYKRVKDFEGKKCWFLGSDIFMEIIEGVDLEIVDSPYDADFILNAISGTSTEGKKQIIEFQNIAKERDLIMLCANPDMVVHIGDELIECAGTYAKIYQDIGGKVEYFGKPYSKIYEAAHEAIGNIDKSRILAIGDSIDTDIKGANDFGIDSLLNLVGIHREEINCTKTDKMDISKLKKLVLEKGNSPNYIISGFNW